MTAEEALQWGLIDRVVKERDVSPSGSMT
jgi:ATP-dependent protease ClpP protease subunit